MKSIKAFLFFISLFRYVYCSCDSNHGPSGSNDCFLGTPEYSKYQWGTCVTREYVKSISKGNYQCRSYSAKYCYYQCMIERYGKDSGPVYNDCLCKPGDVSSINQTLPSYCYSPSGTDCDWYRNCLEERHPCDGTEASYAIKYAKKFCDLYTENYNKFSSIGKNWVDQVRKCLQVQLVPSLRPGKQQTCESIKELAFRSHVPCYVKPSESKTLSFCNIPTKDQLKVFWTIKGAFVDEPVASMKGLFETLETCTINYIHDYSKKIVLGFDRHILSSRRKRSADHHMNESYWIVENVAKIGDEFAKERMWKEKGVLWYTFLIERNEINDTDDKLGIFMAEQRKYDLNYNGTATANLTIEIDEISEEVKNGKIKLSVNGYTLDITEFKGCYDVACNDTYNEVKSIKVRDSSNNCPGCQPRDSHIAILGASIAVISSVLLLLAIICGVCYKRKKRF